MASEQHTEEHNRPTGLRDITRFIRTLIAATLLILFVCFLWRRSIDDPSRQPVTTTETSSRLEKTLKISELSTYQVTYNGVAAIRNDADHLLYYAAYNAKVSIGIDMEKITVSLQTRQETQTDSGKGSHPDTEKNILVVTLPEVTITDIAIDPGSLDYIFADHDANDEHVSITALPACKADAEAECKTNRLLYELAQENAINTVRALTQPFLDQNKDYSLKIIGSGGYHYEE